MKLKIQSKTGNKTICLNRRKAIREQCLNCSGWLCREVSRCQFTDCSLNQFRSGRGKQNPKVRSKAIRDYCSWCIVGSRFEVSKCHLTDCSLFPYRKSTVDRSAEINSIRKLAHIGTVSGNKIENEYQSMDII